MCDRGLKYMLIENNADNKMYSKIKKIIFSNNNTILTCAVDRVVIK